jgi:hypothetical protein
MTDNEKLKIILELQHGNAENHHGLELLGELLKLKIAFKKQIEITPISDELRKKRIMEGEHLVNRGELVIDVPRFVRHWQDVEKVFERHAILRGEATSPEECLKEFIEGGGSLGDIVERHGESGELLHYMMLAVLNPVYETYGEAYGKQLDDATWVQPFCYVCGGAPEMAMLAGDGGKRYLHCRLCDTSWWYAKLKCPYCGNDDLERLVSLTLEHDPSYMLHGCKACNRYVKVVEARAQNGDVFFELEDLRTSHLDGVARNEGFRPY